MDTEFGTLSGPLFKDTFKDTFSDCLLKTSVNLLPFDTPSLLKTWTRFSQICGGLKRVGGGGVPLYVARVGCVAGYGTYMALSQRMSSTSDIWRTRDCLQTGGHRWQLPLLFSLHSGRRSLTKSGFCARSDNAHCSATTYPQFEHAEQIDCHTH